MANKQLRTITFPGLDNKYIVGGFNIVNITASESNGTTIYTPDKTYAEVVINVGRGDSVALKLNSVIYHYAMQSGGTYYFAPLPGTLPTGSYFTWAANASTVIKHDFSYGYYNLADSQKLAGIAAGAEVNVQADWNEAVTTSDAYIKNKPTIPTKTSDLTNDSEYISAKRIVFTADNQGNITCNFTYSQLVDLFNGHDGEAIIIDALLACGLVQYGTIGVDLYIHSQTNNIEFSLSTMILSDTSYQLVVQVYQYVIDSSNQINESWAEYYIGDQTISSSSSNGNIPTSKAVYDYVQSAIGTAIGGAY